MKRILLLLLTVVTVTAFADDFFSDMGESGSELEINGEINLGSYILFDEDNIEDSIIENPVEAIFTAKYSGNKADITVISDIEIDSIELDECYTNIYFDYLSIDAGLFKTVWGKGDKLHVVDMLNPVDYTDYFEDDYLESKIAQPTIKFNIPVGMSGLVELAYIPTFQGDSIPTNGIWEPIESKMLKGLELSLQQMYGESFSIPKQGRDKILKNGQAGARFTSTINGFDYGLQYYYGYNKKPMLTKDMELEYTGLNMIGIEFGKVLFGFNLRGEAAYYVIEDNYDYNMNSVNYVAGFDRNLPIHNVNLNLQVKGSYTPDAPEDETVNTIVGKITDTFDHEKLELTLSGLYGVEEQDYMIKPEVNYKIGDTVEVSAYALLFGGDDETLLGQYDNNDSLSLNIKYKF